MNEPIYTLGDILAVTGIGFFAGLCVMWLVNRVIERMRTGGGRVLDEKDQ